VSAPDNQAPEYFAVLLPQLALLLLVLWMMH